MKKYAFADCIGNLVCKENCEEIKSKKDNRYLKNIGGEMRKITKFVE